MDPLVLLGLVGTLGYGGYRLARKVADEYRAAASQRHFQDQFQADLARQSADAQRKQTDKLRRLNALARDLQLALFHLADAPDFRRAARFAAQAQDIPAPFRLRQFRRFKARILAHMVARLQAGEDPDLLTNTLAELLRHLGVAPFEAEYLRNEAQQQQLPPAPRARPTYEQCVAQLQREHEQRSSILRTLPGLEEDARERLLEAEETRFQQAIEAAGTDQDPSPTP